MEKYQIHHAPYSEPLCLEASHHVESLEEPYDSSKDAQTVYDFIKKLPNGIVQGLLSILKDDFEKRKKHKIPKIEILIDDGDKEAFFVKTSDDFPLLCIDKIDGAVTMMYPVKGAITPESMRGVYISEREGSLELFIHFMSEGQFDRLWCVGKLEQDLRKDAVEWTKKVNSKYRK